MQKLITKLKSFKLAGMVNSLEARMVYANNNSISHSQFLELLCEDESNNRSGNNYNKRVYKAKLPALKTIEDFDFNFQTSIDKKQIALRPSNGCLDNSKLENEIDFKFTDIDSGIKFIYEQSKKEIL